MTCRLKVRTASRVTRQGRRARRDAVTEERDFKSRTEPREVASGLRTVPETTDSSLRKDRRIGAVRPSVGRSLPLAARGTGMTGRGCSPFFEPRAVASVPRTVAETTDSSLRKDRRIGTTRPSVGRSLPLAARGTGMTGRGCSPFFEPRAVASVPRTVAETTDSSLRKDRRIGTVRPSAGRSLPLAVL